MGSIHVPRLSGRRRAGPRFGRTGRMGLAVAVVAAMTLVAGAHYAASAATDAPYGGTAAARPIRRRRPRRGPARLRPVSRGNCTDPILVLLFSFPAPAN